MWDKLEQIDKRYQELGEEYLTRRNKTIKVVQLTREAERLGYQLVLKETV